jgi:hypothetical protein
LTNFKVKTGKNHMADLIKPVHAKEIQKFVDAIRTSDAGEIELSLSRIIASIYADIPEKQRISQGRYSIIKKLGVVVYPLQGQSVFPSKK